MTPKEFKAHCERRAGNLEVLIEFGLISGVTGLNIDPVTFEIFSKHRDAGLSIQAAYRLTINTPEGTA